MTTKTDKGFFVTPLGGVEEIGMNMTIYECDGTMIMVDAGITFPDETTPGVDVIVPDTRYVRDNLHKLKAILITHAHEDHIGAMPYLWEEMPVPAYVTPFAKCVLEGKMSNNVLADLEIVEVTPGKPFNVGPFEIEFIKVTHSVPEGNMIRLKTKYGSVVNTGDYKLDEDPVVGGESDIKRMKEIGDEGVLALCADSTNIYSPGRVPTETSLQDSLETIFKDCDNRLFVTLFASNVERLINVTGLAIKQGRKVGYMGRTLQNMVKYARQCGFFPEEFNEHILPAEEVCKLPKRQAAILLTGAQAQPNAALAKLADGENFKGVEISAGDTVIFSSRKIPGNEKSIYGLFNKLYGIGATVLHDGDAFVHVSGHGYREETKEMYELFRPQIAVPMYGEHQHIVGNVALAKEMGVPKQIVLRNGYRLKLAPGEPEIVDQFIPCGRNYVDGHNILDEDRFILRERRQMSFDGLATATLVVEADTGVIVEGPFIKTKGVIDEDLQGDILKEVHKEIMQSLHKSCDGLVTEPKEGEEIMRQAVRRAFKRERGRRPVTIPCVVQV
jgi:ribonuclease J